MQKIEFKGHLGNPVKPWEVFDWPVDQQNDIYKSWGFYFLNHNNDVAGEKYIQLCLERNPNDIDTLYYGSELARNRADIHKALKYAIKAKVIDKTNNRKIAMALGQCYYDLNFFEENKMYFHDKMSFCKGSEKEMYDNRLRLVNENFNDILGPGTFAFQRGYNQDDLIKTELERKQKSTHSVKDQQCDVVSVIEEEELILAPLEKAMRENMQKKVYNSYLKKKWEDINFIQKLLKNSNLLLSECKISTPLVKRILETTYMKVNTFVKMLQARHGIMREKRGENMIKLHKRIKEENLFRIQNQTRRNMFKILETVRQLRIKQKVPQMRIYINNVMNHYVNIKIHRVMPWKFEFINEVYDTFALTLVEQYRLPNFKISPFNKDDMCKLLRIPLDKLHKQIKFVFGDRSTHELFETPSKIKYKKILAVLEHRMRFSKYHLEKSYLLHEIAYFHLKTNHFPECCSNAHKSYEEAKICKSNIWMFLSLMLICKSHAILHKYERQQDILESAYKLAQKLRSSKLCTFVHLCRMLNNDYLAIRKQTQLDMHKRIRRMPYKAESPGPR